MIKIFKPEEEKPNYVCFDCGKKYLTEVQKKQDRIVTAHLSTCDLCKEHKSVTHIRTFNWLNIPKNEIQ